MATIHHLAARLDQTVSRNDSKTIGARQPSGRSATVILFTGVRYERWTDAPTALEAALSVPVDETGIPLVNTPSQDRLKA